MGSVMTMKHGVSVDQNLCISDIHMIFMCQLCYSHSTHYSVCQNLHILTHSWFVTSIACGILVYTSRLLHS